MSLQVTTLIENTIGEHLGLASEHGIAFYIERDGMKMLFDTGQSDSFLNNAKLLQIDLTDVRHVVLSHGHYDHSGGFSALAEVITGFDLWIGEGFFVPKYGTVNGSYEFLGNDFDESFLHQHAISFKNVSQAVTEIEPGVYIITRFPRIHPDEVVNPRFVLKTPDGFIPDDFSDEVLVALDTPKGLVVLLGCSHPGMRNMLDAVKHQLGRPIHAVLGGTHLVEAQGVCLQKSITYLEHGDIEIVGVSHCTGTKAMTHISETNSRYFHNRTGTSLFVE
ncbi:MAG: MBL fold metallo-hydrolase [Spirochaetia bacterium]|nr:MBL fold metallo-hydrolase [Spirochaetia bacterium]MCF7940674.1 MBL fold metallo-hydrolase [Spirochaetia bacterium]